MGRWHTKQKHSRLVDDIFFNYPVVLDGGQELRASARARGARNGRHLLSVRARSAKHTTAARYMPQHIRSRCWTEQDLGGVHRCDYA